MSVDANYQGGGGGLLYFFWKLGVTLFVVENAQITGIYG